MIWTVSVLADSSPQLADALSRAGVDASRQPALKRLREGPARVEDGRWCADLLAAARKRGAKA
jgi:hypothetical protein